jgi:hypothetical protein
VSEQRTDNPTARMVEAGIKQLLEHPEDAEYVRELYAPEQDRRHAAMARLVTAIFVAMETERAGR